MNYIYFIKSLKNGKIYVGYTETDPKIRLKQHNTNSNFWTKENKPFILLYYERYYCKTGAIMREKFYKSGFGRKIRDAIIKSVSAKGVESAYGTRSASG
ncbi:MAG: GIY-YIG nuclease family protein [Patescibacteria group bacterium]